MYKTGLISKNKVIGGKPIPSNIIGIEVFGILPVPPKDMKELQALDGVSIITDSRAISDENPTRHHKIKSVPQAIIWFGNMTLASILKRVDWIRVTLCMDRGNQELLKHPGVSTLLDTSQCYGPRRNSLTSPTLAWARPTAFMFKAKALCPVM